MTITRNSRPPFLIFGLPALKERADNTTTLHISIITGNQLKIRSHTFRMYHRGVEFQFTCMGQYFSGSLAS